MKIDKLLYTREEAAGQLSISIRNLSRLVLKGLIRPRRVGGRTLFTIRELERFVNDDKAALGTSEHF